MKKQLDRRKFLVGGTSGLVALSLAGSARALEHDDGCEPPPPGSSGEEPGERGVGKIIKGVLGTYLVFVGSGLSYSAGAATFLGGVMIFVPVDGPVGELGMFGAGLVLHSLGNVAHEHGAAMLGLAYDPPNPDYKRVVQLDGLDIHNVPIDWGNHPGWLDGLTADELAMLQRNADFLDAQKAFLDAIECLQGAEEARDVPWMLTHLNTLVELADQLGSTASSPLDLVETGIRLLDEALAQHGIDDSYEFNIQEAMDNSPAALPIRNGFREWANPLPLAEEKGNEALLLAENSCHPHTTISALREHIDEMTQKIAESMPELSDPTWWMNDICGDRPDVIAQGVGGKGGSGVGLSPTKMTGLSQAEFRTGRDLQRVHVKTGDVLVLTSKGDQDSEGLTMLSNGISGIRVHGRGSKDDSILVDASDVIDSSWDSIEDATWVLLREKTNSGRSDDHRPW